MSVTVNGEHQIQRQRNLMENRDLKSLAIGWTGLVLALIAAAGLNALEARPACIEWNREVANMTQMASALEQDVNSTEKAYAATAGLHCQMTFDYRHPDMIFPDERSEFCEYKANPVGGFSVGPNYPKDKIPEKWRDEKDYGSLTSYVKAAQKARNYFEKTKEKLRDKIAQKPLFCSKGR